MTTPPFNDDIKRLRSKLEKERANQLKLETCARHKFSSQFVVSFSQIMTCDHCEGKMHPNEVDTYIRGYVAAGRSFADIWPYWRKERHGLTSLY